MAHRQHHTAKPSKDERALAKLDRRLADARLEVDRRARQLARANADVADLEARRAALLEAHPGAVVPVPAAVPAAPARTGRPATRSRARRSPRSGTTGGTAGGG